MSVQFKRQLSGFVSLVILLTLSACAGDGEDPGYTHVIAENAIVRFEAVPALLQIQDVAVAQSGEVWALQRTRAPHLFWFSEDGQLIDSRGMSGSGRGQLSNPFNLLPTNDARIPMRVCANTTVCCAHITCPCWRRRSRHARSSSVATIWALICSRVISLHAPRSCRDTVSLWAN